MDIISLSSRAVVAVFGKAITRCESLSSSGWSLGDSRGPHAYCWTCCSVFIDWARGRVDDEVLPLASDVYASVVLTFIRRSAAKALSEKELAAIDRARELVIAGFGAQYLSGRSETCDRW